MCKAVEYIEKLSIIYDEIQDDYERYSSELKHQDLLQQDILHAIENESFNASRGYVLAKMIQELRIARRKVKDELEPLTMLNDMFIAETMADLDTISTKIKNKEIILKDRDENKKYKSRTKEGKALIGNQHNTTQKLSKIDKEILKRNFKPNAIIRSSSSSLDGKEVQVLNDLGKIYSCCLINGEGVAVVQDISKSKIRLMQS